MFNEYVRSSIPQIPVHVDNTCLEGMKKGRLSQMHLHDEIEEDDKKHSLATIRSVEDVISDALKRLDGKMVDEIEDRHLDHV